MPTNFKVPHLETYDGSGDPLDHLNAQKSSMAFITASLTWSLALLLASIILCSATLALASLSFSKALNSLISIA